MRRRRINKSVLIRPYSSVHRELSRDYRHDPLDSRKTYSFICGETQLRLYFNLE